MVYLQYRGSSASIITLSSEQMWHHIGTGWFQIDAGKSKAKRKLKGLFAWSEVKWNTKKSSAPKRPSLFALTSYLVPTEGDEHACLCKDCVVCGLTMFTLHCVNVHVVAKVTFACSMLVSSHLKKSQSVRRHGLVHGLATFEKDNVTCTCSRHIGANASLTCIMPDLGSYSHCIYSWILQFITIIT